MRELQYVSLRHVTSCCQAMCCGVLPCCVVLCCVVLCDSMRFPLICGAVVAHHQELTVGWPTSQEFYWERHRLAQRMERVIEAVGLQVPILPPLFPSFLPPLLSSPASPGPFRGTSFTRASSGAQRRVSRVEASCLHRGSLWRRGRTSSAAATSGAWPSRCSW